MTAIRRAALVHEFGTTGVPNSILDKPGPLTRAELDRVELHPMLTEQMLRRSPAFAALNPFAASHHERANGSGYHKGLRAERRERGARILAAVDVYVGLTTDAPTARRHRQAAAAVELRGLDPRRARRGAVEAVLRRPATANRRRNPRRQHPAGLTRREVEVLHLAARGLTTKAIAARALHLAEDRRPSHPARLHEDRGLDASGGGAVGDGARARRHGA